MKLKFGRKKDRKKKPENASHRLAKKIALKVDIFKILNYKAKC